MAKRLSYEDIKERIEKEGYVLLSKEYINNKQKLDWDYDNIEKLIKEKINQI